MKISNNRRKYFILGLGKTGCSIIEWLNKNSIFDTIEVWDDSESVINSIKQKYKVLINQYPYWDSESHILIQSPGISLNHPLSNEARKFNIPILTDFDLFSNFYPEISLIGVTGTNGKSTTVTAIQFTLENIGIKSFCRGNIGTPILKLPVPDNDSIGVIELSSYHLEISSIFDLDIGICLNIQKDHLDRHNTFDQYVNTKERIALMARYGFILGVEDLLTSNLYKKYKELNKNIIPVSSTLRFPFKGIFINNGVLIDNFFEQEEIVCDLKLNRFLYGLHNWQNLASSYAALRIYGIEKKLILENLINFKGLKHRQQIIKEVNSIIFVNDSKATNSSASEKALISFNKIYWILGGRQKEGGIYNLKPYFKKVMKAFLIGEAQNEFRKVFQEENVKYECCETLDKAVYSAYLSACKEDEKITILFSPACASFDQYKNFEDRGDHFCNLINNLQ